MADLVTCKRYVNSNYYFGAFYHLKYFLTYGAAAKESQGTNETRTWHSWSLQPIVQLKMKRLSHFWGECHLAKSESPDESGSCFWKILNTRDPGRGTIQLGPHFLHMVTVLSFSETNQSLLTVLWELRITGRVYAEFLELMYTLHRLWFRPKGDNLGLILETNEYIIIINYYLD